MSISNNKITMPRCCGACDHWKFVGRALPRPHSEKTAKYGKCGLKKAKTWMVQACNSFTAESDCFDIEVVTLPNNLILEPIQESLL